MRLQNRPVAQEFPEGADYASASREALTAILGGRSTPGRTYHRRARIHVVSLRDGSNVRVVYDRSVGEITSLEWI